MVNNFHSKQTGIVRMLPPGDLLGHSQEVRLVGTWVELATNAVSQGIFRGIA
jgi:hypothetical protein